MFGLSGTVLGLLNSARTILDSGLGMVQNRVELFSAELQEERLRIFRTILYAAALVTLGILTLALFTATLIFAFWESARLAVMGGLTLLYFLGTVLLYRKLNGQLHQTRPLSATLEEIKRDRECLGVRK
jgi:uncharacterized membrane protein YqjE